MTATLATANFGTSQQDLELSTLFGSSQQASSQLPNKLWKLPTEFQNIREKGYVKSTVTFGVNLTRIIYKALNFF